MNSRVAEYDKDGFAQQTDKDGKSAAVSESPSAYGPGMLGSVKQNGGWHPWARFEEPSIWQ